MPAFPTLEELKVPEEDKKLIEEIEDKVLVAGYNLLKKINDIYEEKGIELQIATSESLTAGLIMSSLVKLPIAGWCKYGGFAVYDTDAKRVYNSVKVDDVYTHKCAKEMAVGQLNNSTATLSIAVTGNAMPYFEEKNRLGEVFIGIAGYRASDDVIIYETHVVNGCLDEGEIFTDKCKSWLRSQPTKKHYAKRSDTAAISRIVRNYTALKSMELALNFITQNDLGIPEFINERKKLNKQIDSNGCLHNGIPNSKYPEIKAECVNARNEYCKESELCDRGDLVNLIPLGWEEDTQDRIIRLQMETAQSVGERQTAAAGSTYLNSHGGGRKKKSKRNKSNRRKNTKRKNRKT